MMENLKKKKKQNINVRMCPQFEKQTDRLEKASGTFPCESGL